MKELIDERKESVNLDTLKIELHPYPIKESRFSVNDDGNLVMIASVYPNKVDGNKVQKINCDHDDPVDKWLYCKSSQICSLIEVCYAVWSKSINCNQLLRRP